MEQTEQNIEQKNTPKGIDGCTLKLIAIITMLIDHIGAGVLLRIVHAGGSHKVLWNSIYTISRCIGRISFPIFCFLLVEGFLHTRSVKKYALRLLAFCAISEIPFDFCFFSKITMGYQNIFFTLLIGLLAINAIHYFEQKDFGVVKQKLLTIVCLVLAMLIAYLLHTDYEYWGVLAIVVLYLCRENKNKQLAGGICAFLFELPFAQIAFLPIALYNGKRGKSLKYFFYFFYPVHLALLYAFVYFTGLVQFPAM